MEKIKLALLMGGPSSEHEVSLRTGKMILGALNKKKYDVYPVLISKKCLWKFSDDEVVSEAKAIQRLKREACDIVFIAMHGEYGEDGVVQGLLENAGIKFTGSGSKASALGMDKEASSEVFENGGLLVPRYLIINKNDRGGLAHDFKYPLVVKPVDRGSSVGVSVARDNEEFLTGIAEAFKFSDRVMIQEFISGRELTCGVIEKNGAPIALLPTEIIPKRGTFFDFKSKYESGGSEEITPPHLSQDVILEIQNVALRAHALIGARGMSRTDVILSVGDVRNVRDVRNEQAKRSNNSNDSNTRTNLYVLEINTIPGMTETSLLPQEAKAMGISFSELLDLIIEAGLSN